MTRNTCMLRSAIAIAVGLGVSAPAFAYPDFDIRGRLHLDYAAHNSDDIDLGDGFANRRARIGVNGKFSDEWDGRIEVDFAEEGNSANDFRLRRTLGPGRLIIGQTKVPQGLNNLTSSNSITFIERASSQNAFVDGRRMGIGYAASPGNLHYEVKLYGRAIGDSKEGEGQDDPIGLGGRLVFNPIHNDNNMLHLGGWASSESYDDTSGLRFRERPEARPAGVRLIDTGEISDVSSVIKAGFEFAYQTGPFSIEYEYITVDVDRDDGDEPDFDGFHVQASYILTGESRSYGGGSFGGVTPSTSAGAWELAARYSSVDLNDGDFEGGEQNNVTLGVNYYATSNLRFMANAIFVDVEDSGATVYGDTDSEVGDESPSIFLVRAQYNF